MKEIIHIRAGNLSNFIGTHYFNTLESYFASKEHLSEEIAHGVSFRDGIAPDGSETFLPRLVLFDYKPNFGALSQSSTLYENLEEDENAENGWCASSDLSAQ